MTDPSAMSSGSLGLDDEPERSGNDGSLFSSTFSTISGRLQKAVTSTQTPSSSGSHYLSSKKFVGTMENDKELDHDQPSETESTTSESSEALHLTSEDLSILEAKVQILYGQLHARETTIQQLKQDHQNNFEIFERESAECIEELSNEVDDLRDKLQDKDDRISELESLQIIPEHLLEGDHEENLLAAELENLRHQLQYKDARIAELEVSQGAGDTGDSRLRFKLDRMEQKMFEKDEMLHKLEESENLNFSLVEERDEEIERLTAKISDMTAKLNSGRECRIDDIEKAETVSVNEAPKSAEDGSLLAQQEELETLLEESETKCRGLQEQVDKLSCETNQVSEIKAHLQKEKLQYEDLRATTEKLSIHLQEKDRKMNDLGFASEVELIDAHHETQKRLKSKEEEVQDLSRRLAISESGKSGKKVQQPRRPSEEDQKSVENLLRQEKALRQELKGKVRALTSEMKKRDVEDEMDIQTFYYHLSKQIMAIVGSLSACDGISSDLIKAFQLKLEYSSSLERQLESREAQIAMLLQELEELEQNKDNLCTSINSSSSTLTSVALSSKLEELLLEIHERDEKAALLEWLTVDLSKTLEAQTDEFEDYRLRAEMQEQKHDKRIKQLLSETSNRETSLSEAKSKREALEIQLVTSDAQRENLKTTMDSLTESLIDAENKITTLETQLELKRQEELQQEEPKELVNSLAQDREHAEEEAARLKGEVERVTLELATERDNSQGSIESLTDDLRVASDHIESLETEIDSKSNFIQMRERQLEEMSAALREGERDCEQAEVRVNVLREELEQRYYEVETLVCVLARHQESLTKMEHAKQSSSEALQDAQHELSTILQAGREKEQRIGELEAAQEASVTATKKLEQRLKESLDGIDQLHQENAQLTKDICKLRDQNCKLLSNVEHKEQKLGDAKALEKQLLARHQQSVTEMEHAKQSSSEALLDAKHKLSTILQAGQGKEQRIGELEAAQEASAAATKKLEQQLKESLDGVDQLSQENVQLTKDICKLDQLKELNAKLLADLKGWEGRVGELECLVSAKDEVFKEMTVIEELLREQTTRTQELLDEIGLLKSSLEEKEKELGLAKADNEKQQGVIHTLQKDGYTHLALQERCAQLENELEVFTERCQTQDARLEEKTSLLSARERDHDELQGRYEDQQESLRRAGRQMESMRQACLATSKLENRLEASLKECNWKQEKIDELSRRCQDCDEKLEREREEFEVKKHQAEAFVEEIKSLAQDLERVKMEAEENEMVILGSVEGKEEELRSLQSIESAMMKQIQEKCEDIVMLEKELTGKNAKCTKLQMEVEALTQTLGNTRASLADVQQKADDQSNDLRSIMEEHEGECTELREKLDALTRELQATNLRLLDVESEELDTKTLEASLHRLRDQYKTLQVENDRVHGKLEAIGFESMDDLVLGLAVKCEEHDAMKNVIEDRNHQIFLLRKDVQLAKEMAGHGPDVDPFMMDSRTNVAHIHKIKELETKLGMFRDEIAGKNAIIEDLTLRLNGKTASDDAYSCAGSNTVSSSSKEAPGLRMKRVSSPLKTSNQSPEQDESASKTAKALATIPDLIEALKERDATINSLQQEISASKRAIEGLVKGLEYNVQEKIEADRLVHEKKTQCSKFAFKVQHLNKQLQDLEKHTKRSMNRNLANMDEIKSLSVNELVDLLRQSRLLSEDLSDERERLIANATNMSIALAESRGRVDELMDQLDRDATDEDEPGRIQTRAKPGTSQSRKSKSVTSQQAFGRPVSGATKVRKKG